MKLITRTVRPMVEADESAQTAATPLGNVPYAWRSTSGVHAGDSALTKPSLIASLHHFFNSN